MIKMKLTNKQKSIIWKSLKLNEDFFDDFNNNDLIDDIVDVLIDEPEYTYNVHFIIFINPFINNPFIKHNHNDEYVYYFEEPKYKPIT